MSWLAMAMLLFIAAIVIFIFELFIPSGGLLVAITAMLAIGANIVAFFNGFYTGMFMLLATFLAIPMMILVFLHVWPKTPMGKRIIVEPVQAESFVWSDAQKSKNISSLIGTTGITLEELLPSGKVQIESESYESFSETGPIEKGKLVSVQRLDLGRLVVIEVREKNKTEPMSTNTGLDRPAEELDIESLEG